MYKTENHCNYLKFMYGDQYPFEVHLEFYHLQYGKGRRVSRRRSMSDLSITLNNSSSKIGACGSLDSIASSQSQSSDGSGKKACPKIEAAKEYLVELPQYGHKQWQTYFGRTFDVYTKLWKYQQQHRLILDNKYGLKRWQIGEIASKIGQLYYHFYLRTSEIIYLHEAFSFYSAIRNRKYYTEASQEDRCELMIKKLRYYARYIVVCLLLKNIKLVKELIKELDRQIIEYGNTYNAEDQMEWTVVVDEVRAFVQVEPVVSVIHPENHAISLSHRLSPQTTPPVEITPQMILCLQEVLIVGSSSEQVKFSELTLDMFRILQTLEREPTGDILPLDDELLRPRFVAAPSLPNSKAYGGERSNPHKYLLYKPSPSQVLVFLASACNELPPDGALLLYISAEGQVEPPYKNSEIVGYEVRGLVTTSKNDIYRESSKETKGGPPKHREIQCLHPGDLCPFTRRPMFLIIDSDNSSAFQNMPRQFGQPLVILMSPVDVPPQIQDRKHQGNLFTLFLHSPLTAFAFCCDVRTLSLIHWESAQVYVDNFMAEASRLLTASRVDPMYLSFMGDDFLRQLVVRYIFCEVTLRAHRAFRARSQLPRTSPPLPDDVMEHPTLISIVIDLATYLKVNSFFYDTGAGCSSNTKD